MSDADFLIIGSGPAGVSAAVPLVERGHRVLMVDGGAEEPAPQSPAERMLGGALEGLTVEDGLSPKLRTPEARRALSRFAEANPVRTENFLAIGALARGGLSRVWGAFAGEFDARDLTDWPVPYAELASSYTRVGARIGISGSVDDDARLLLGRASPLQPPLALGSATARLLRRYAAVPRGALQLGRARNAVISETLDDRPACDLRGACLWGCPIGAIYDSRQDLARLARHANFRLAQSDWVTAIGRIGAGWQIRTRDGQSFSAPRLILAAGTLGSTALVAPLLPAMVDWPLLNNPVMAAPLLLPAMLAARTVPSHSLAQLAFFLRFGEAPLDYVSGAVYETQALPPSSFVNQLPLGRRAGEAVFRTLSPGLLVAVCYFPGSTSDNRLRFDRSAGTLTVRGGEAASLAPLAGQVSCRLRQAWRALGAWPLPGGKLAPPGTDSHFAGTCPMGGKGPNGTSMLGELSGQQGLHIVDGAVLPTLPSKHATFSIMANADRIGTALAGLPAR
jgi:choline dehydrogenase-like flavoprotein